MEPLFDFFNQLQPLSQGLMDLLLELVKHQSAPKGTIVQYPGQQYTPLCFIFSGLLKGYRVENGRQICAWFHNEGNAVMSLSSWYRRQPADEYIEALEDTEFVYVYQEDMDQLFRQYPEFNLHVRILTEKYYLFVWEWFNLVRTKKAHERYAFFLQHFGDWVRRVPSKDIASFLGVSPAHFSYSKRKR